MQDESKLAKSVTVIKANRFASDDSGAIAVIFAAVVLVLLVTGGGATDFGLAFKKNAELQKAADTAALAAGRSAVEYLAAHPNATEAEWNQAADLTGNQIFLSNLPDPSSRLSTSLNITHATVDGRIETTASFTSEHANSFLKLMGINKLDIAGRAVARTGGPKFVKVNYIVDLSPSMGIGATSSDQQTLSNRIGCTIACHYDDTWGARNTLAAARATGATLRIDVVRNAIVTMLQRLKANSSNGSSYEIAIQGYSNSLIDIIAPTTNIDAAIAAAQTLEVTGLVAQGGSNLQYSLQQFSSQAGNSGTGSTADDRKIYTVLVSDGVENSIINYLNSTSSPTLMKPAYDTNFTLFSPWQRDNPVEISQGFNPASCTALKNKDHTVLAIHVEYLVPTIWPDSGESRFQYINNTLKPNIRTNMEACVTNPSYLVNASSPSEIANAADRVYASITAKTLHLKE